MNKASVSWVLLKILLIYNKIKIECNKRGSSVPFNKEIKLKCF